jgi:hypothetical protein
LGAADDAPMARRRVVARSVRHLVREWWSATRPERLEAVRSALTAAACPGCPLRGARQAPAEVQQPAGCRAAWRLRAAAEVAASPRLRLRGVPEARVEAAVRDPEDCLIPAAIVLCPPVAAERESACSSAAAAASSAQGLARPAASAAQVSALRPAEPAASDAVVWPLPEVAAGAWAGAAVPLQVAEAAVVRDVPARQQEEVAAPGGAAVPRLAEEVAAQRRAALVWPVLPAAASWASRPDQALPSARPEPPPEARSARAMARRSIASP